MPSIQDNLERWNLSYDWPSQGDEWSEMWGGASSQWFGTILPRVRSFLPARRVLEFGPGFGRWTKFLQGWCTELVLVHITPKCIKACRQRFASLAHLRYHVNDGQSLAVVDDHSIDLAFSFDSLVHVESDVLFGYIAE